MGFTISKNQGSGRTVITVTPEEKNTTDKDIVQILTVEAVDGSTKEVKLIHKKGEGNYEYTFRVSPTELYFEPTGESKEVTIVSTKQMVINGKKVGDPVNVNYTRENSGDVSGSGTTLIMSLNDNTHNDKLGQVIFIQDESGKTVVVTCRQGKKENTVGGDIGLIQLWSGSGVPEGYVLCDGSQVSIAEYPELYKAIGDKYNTASTKAGYISVPDLRGRFVVGYDPRNYEYERIGNTGGQALVTLTLDQIPPHSHKITFKEEKWGDNASNRPFPNHTRPDSDYTADTQVIGGGSPHENRPPYYVLAYVMKIR
jgi:microcystin-dependent protein